VEWSEQRFEARDGVVLDRLTGLVWTQNANLAEFPVTWQESLGHVSSMNRGEALGCQDWRLPNRRELRSLISHQERKPALPVGHPFVNVFPGWYWTSTTAAINTSYAWYIHLDGGRMFYGGKEQSFLLWPVRGRGYGILPATGQRQCYGPKGDPLPCAGSGQDGELRYGFPWPEPRFENAGVVIIDWLTGLRWQRNADLTGSLTTWREALETTGELNRRSEGVAWRLPNINELETLVDCSAHSPASALRPPVRECTGSILVIDHEHVRTRLGLGTVSSEGRCRRRTKEGCSFRSVGCVRYAGGEGPPAGLSSVPGMGTKSKKEQCGVDK
jgi:hypothetical protein